jgi:hypothetical protein
MIRPLKNIVQDILLNYNVTNFEPTRHFKPSDIDPNIQELKDELLIVVNSRLNGAREKVQQSCAVNVGSFILAVDQGLYIGDKKITDSGNFFTQDETVEVHHSCLSLEDETNVMFHLYANPIVAALAFEYDKVLKEIMGDSYVTPICLVQSDGIIFGIAQEYIRGIQLDDEYELSERGITMKEFRKQYPVLFNDACVAAHKTDLIDIPHGDICRKNLRIELDGEGTPLRVVSYDSHIIKYIIGIESKSPLEENLFHYGLHSRSEAHRMKLFLMGAKGIPTF